MYCVYGNISWYIRGGPLFGGGPLLGGFVIGGSTVVIERRARCDAQPRAQPTSHVELVTK